MRDMAKLNPTVFDLDADDEFQEALDEAKSGDTYIPVKLFDEEWRIRTVSNAWNLMGVMGGDGLELRKAILNLVHDDEQDKFSEVMSGRKDLDPKALAMLYTKLLTAVTNRPTERSSPSSTTPRKRTSATRSKAASSSRAGAQTR